MGESAKRFGISSWADVGSLAGLVLIGVGVISWGLKLESRIDAKDRRLDALEAQVGNGILPRAEERISDLERRINRLEDEE